MRNFLVISLITGGLLASGCGDGIFQGEKPPTPLSAVPAVRLNFRYEADVPAPTLDASRNQERDAAVQSDFDANRSQELLDGTLASPDKKYVLAIYHNITDAANEYRLDMYSPDGTPLRKMTSDAMAVHFPDTIVWSPDSASLAFVAMLRAAPGSSGVTLALASPSPTPTGDPLTIPAETIAPEETATPAQRTMAAPTGILTYRSEQIYIASADGTNVKAITANEGLMYFYYAWSPDSQMLAALAATTREWRLFEVVAASKGEMMIPQGRLRIIEKNGRERRLDDNMTAVRPVWSADSSKVATAFEHQIRIYDAGGSNPTQAAIPLRNQLLISSQAFDYQLAANELGANGAAPPPAEPMSTLPDPANLVSFNPIVLLAWPSDDLLYLETAYVKALENPADSTRSYSRWHRLAFSAQPTQSPK